MQPTISLVGYMHSHRTQARTHTHRQARDVLKSTRLNTQLNARLDTHLDAHTHTHKYNQPHIDRPAPKQHISTHTYNHTQYHQPHIDRPAPKASNPSSGGSSTKEGRTSGQNNSDATASGGNAAWNTYAASAAALAMAYMVECAFDFLPYI